MGQIRALLEDTAATNTDGNQHHSLVRYIYEAYDLLSGLRSNCCFTGV